MTLFVQSDYTPEIHSQWRGRDYTTPAVGILRVYKPEGMHREQVFSVACVKLRMLIREMFEEDERECGLCAGTGSPGPYRDGATCPRCLGTGKVDA